MLSGAPIVNQSRASLRVLLFQNPDKYRRLVLEVLKDARQ
jgi:hypothetical protein